MLRKILSLTILCLSPALFAQQSADDLEVINLESLYKSSTVVKPVEVKGQTGFDEVKNQEPMKADQIIENIDNSTVETESSAQPVRTKSGSGSNVGELKDLSRLSPFREVSVIQKKYLPKTERFQFFGGLSTTTNTPWFLNVGGKLNLAYHFNESFGLELNTLFLTNSEREVTKEILDEHNLKADQFIYTKAYYGLDLMWSPIYGKLSHIDGGIIPFDMYFSVGGGISSTSSKEKDVSTLHIGVGQIFAITKAIAFRWDYSFNMFQATPISTGTSTAPTKGSYNDLVLTAGVSIFFPEAGER
jgi:outer membrane beta-barrel protein